MALIARAVPLARAFRDAPEALRRSTRDREAIEVRVPVATRTMVLLPAASYGVLDHDPRRNG